MVISMSIMRDNTVDIDEVKDVYALFMKVKESPKEQEYVLVLPEGGREKLRVWK